MTPSELKKVAQRIADLLARDSNEDLTAEELSSEIASAAVEVYEEIQAKAYNVIVLGHFTTGDGEYHVSAVGPLSTRAQQRARGIGERFAWDYKTRKGTGRYTLVPLVRDPSQAWDEARQAEVRVVQDVTRPSLSLEPFGPACVCGLDREQLLVCPRHPEGRDGSGT